MCTHLIYQMWQHISIYIYKKYKLFIDYVLLKNTLLGINFISGVHGAIRTPDRSLRRRMLYPLSYEDILCTHLIYQMWQHISIYIYKKYKLFIDYVLLKNTLLGINFISGVHGAIRTPDRSLRRRMLYPLSYEDISLNAYLYYYSDR